MKQDTTEQLAKAIPAVVGAGITLSDVSTMVAIVAGLLTSFYVVVQIAFLIWKWHRLATRGEESTLG